MRCLITNATHTCGFKSQQHREPRSSLTIKQPRETRGQIPESSSVVSACWAELLWVGEAKHQRAVRCPHVWLSTACVQVWVGRVSLLFTSSLARGAERPVNLPADVREAEQIVVWVRLGALCAAPRLPDDTQSSNDACVRSLCRRF